MKTEEHADSRRLTDSPSSAELLEQIALLAAEKKASAIVELDLRQFVSYADSFLLCTGNNERQTKAIADSIAEGVRERFGLKPRRVEGLTQASWILLDYLDVVVHIFTPATRDFYRLESLWGEAPVHQIDPDAIGAGESEPAPAGRSAQMAAAAEHQAEIEPGPQAAMH